jgi:hypothetical protein
MNTAQLQMEWNQATQEITAAGSSTGVFGLCILLTRGLSSRDIAIAASRIHNARRKRSIIRQHLQRRGITPIIHVHDVMFSVAMAAQEAVSVVRDEAETADGMADN